LPLPRICVLCVIPGLGGAEISLLELVGRLRDRYEFHLVVPGEGRLKERAKARGAKVWILPWPEAIAKAGEVATRPSFTSLIRSASELRPLTATLARILQEISPSIFITNAIKAHILGALTPRDTNIPLIWYMRDGLENRMISRRALAALAHHCDLALCISRYVASQVRKYVSRSIKNSVLYNIIDIDRFQPRTTAPSDLQKDSEGIWFGVIGPLTPLKGHPVFLDAAQRVIQRLPDSVFVIVGNNPYSTESSLNYERLLRERVENSDLKNHVRFLGFQDDIPRVLSCLDVFVQPNVGPEGLGRSVLEAMACALPVIAVNRWGPAELIENGQTGLLFPCKDAKALADQMVLLGQDRALRTEIGLRARHWMQLNFAPDLLVHKFDQLLAGTIARRARGARSA
jgi:glycosyltransferase involved in cell wall biosynthesis